MAVTVARRRRTPPRGLASPTTGGKEVGDALAARWRRRASRLLAARAFRRLRLASSDLLLRLQPLLSVASVAAAAKEPRSSPGPPLGGCITLRRALEA